MVKKINRWNYSSAQNEEFQNFQYKKYNLQTSLRFLQVLYIYIKRLDLLAER